jgi:hypothetical protein
MRLRGLSGVRDEFHLAATVQNLKTLALPPPDLAPAWSGQWRLARVLGQLPRMRAT